MKVTIYSKAEFLGMRKTEGTLVQHGTRPFAQYPAMPFVQFIPKGKRHVREIMGDGFRSYILILEGHGHPEPDGMFADPHHVTAEVSVSRGRHSSASMGWYTDLDAKLNPYIAEGKGKVVADYRFTSVAKPA